MRKILLNSVDDVIKAAEYLKQPESLDFIEQVASKIFECFGNGGKILIAGNGGSLCDAMHFAEELTGFYRAKREALPAIALSDPGHMSCVGNDIGFEYVFSRGVEALGKEEDILIVLTTSGQSSNLMHAISSAKARNMTTIAFLGKTGGTIKDECDCQWIVPGFGYSDRIQEAHMAAIHIIIEIVELKLTNQYALSQCDDKSYSSKM